MDTRFLSISAAARAVGRTEITVRKLDAIVKPLRDSTGRRLYTMKDIETMRRYLAAHQPGRPRKAAR